MQDTTLSPPLPRSALPVLKTSMRAGKDDDDLVAGVGNPPSLTEQAAAPNTQRMRRSAAKMWHEFRTGQRLYGHFNEDSWREMLTTLMAYPPTAKSLKKFIAWAHTDKGMAYETIQSYVSHLNVMCKLYLGESPRSDAKVKMELAASRKLRPPLKRHSKAITSDVLVQILKGATPICRAAIMTAYTFGLRINELLAIKGKDVALDGRIMTLTIPTSKTARGVPKDVTQRLYTSKDIGLPFSHLKAILFLKETFGDGRLFPMSEGTYRKMFARAVKAAGLDPAQYKPHGCRSGRESDMLMVAQPHETLPFSRHADIRTAMKHYHEVNLKRTQVELGDRVIFKGGNYVQD